MDKMLKQEINFPLSRYLYCGKMCMDDDTVLSLAYLSDRYRVEKLKEECIAYFKQHVMSIGNVLEYMEHSEYVISEIRMAMMFMVQLHPEAILEKGHKKLSLGSLRNLLKLEFFNCTEYFLYRVCYSWAEKRCIAKEKVLTSKNVRKQLQELLHWIRFPVMNLDEFNLVAEDKVLTAEETHAVFQYLEEGRESNEKNKLPFNIVARSNYTTYPYTDRREVELCDPQELNLAGPIQQCRKGCLAFRFTKSVIITGFRLQLNELMSPSFGEDPIPLNVAVVSCASGEAGPSDTVMFTEEELVEAQPKICKYTKHRFHEIKLKTKVRVDAGKKYFAVIASEVPLYFYKAFPPRDNNWAHDFAVDVHETANTCHYLQAETHLIHGIRYVH